MKLVKEDKFGAYIAPTPALLEKFILKEHNPNFDVFDSNDGCNRLVFAKSPRLPDDNDFTGGRYGINYHRWKPGYDEAYGNKDGMKHVSDTRHLLNDMAFVASSRDEYEKKAAAWDKFYTYIWGKEPLTIWVTPHSGSVDRPPDSLIPWPKLEHDAFVAGVTAVCALNNNRKPVKRIMMSIHSHNWLGAVLDVGSFGIVDESRLAGTAQIINLKYHENIQALAADCKKRFFDVAMNWVNYVIDTKKTLNPLALADISTFDQGIITLIIRSLNLYGREIKKFTSAEFSEAITSLGDTALQVMSCNHLFPGKHISGLLGLRDKIHAGQLDTAVQIECLKIYLEKAPALISNIILDIKNGLFN